MAIRPIEYLIFDMDGLLIDSERIYTQVTNAILAPYGETLTWAIKAGTMGQPEREATQHLLSHYPTVPLTVDEYITRAKVLKDELFRTVQPLPGALKLLTHLHKHAKPGTFKIVLATSSSRANFLIKSTHLSHLFSLFSDNIICADDGHFAPGRGKPCPDIFLAAANMLGANLGMNEHDVSADQCETRRKCLVFEDAVPGVEAANRAGMGVIWIPDKELVAAFSDKLPQVDERLDSLEEFIPQKWGLPPYTESS